MDDPLKVFLGIVQTGGPAMGAVMTILWWLERQERRSLQKERDGLLERVLSSMNTTATSMNALVAGTERRDDAFSAMGGLLTKISDGLQTLAGRRR